jgi:NhaP-type Na+/H+ or K+/H+ antiporter
LNILNFLEGLFNEIIAGIILGVISGIIASLLFTKLTKPNLKIDID